MDRLIIYYSKIEISDNELDKIEGLVPKTFEIVKDYKSEYVKKQTLLSKCMVLKNLNCKEDDIYYNALKKPYVKNNLYFNISHSKDYIVFVSSKNEIGIDIEKIDIKNLNILNYAFTKEEIDFIKNEEKFLDDEESRLTMIWTIKESLFKASGIEKYIEPKKIEVDLSKIDLGIESKKSIIKNTINFMETEYYIYTIKHVDYIISVASTDEYEDIDLVYQEVI